MFDEQISQALNRALASLHQHLEGDVSALTRELVAAALEERARATAQAEAQLAQLRETAQQQTEDIRRAAEAQMAELRATMQAQLEEVQRGAQARVDDAKRASQAQVDESLRAAQAEIAAVRGVADALKAELDETQRQARADIDRARGEREALERDGQQGQQADLPGAARLTDAIRAMDDARSLGEVLDALTECAGREVERAAVLIVKGNGLRGWRLAGFDGHVPQARAIELDLDAAGVAGTVVRAVTAVCVDPSTRPDEADLPTFARGAGTRHALAMPVLVGGRVVAVLYADGRSADASSAVSRWPAVLEILTRHASRVLESLTVQRAAGLAP